MNRSVILRNHFCSYSGFISSASSTAFANSSALMVARRAISSEALGGIQNPHSMHSASRSRRNSLSLIGDTFSEQLFASITAFGTSKHRTPSFSGRKTTASCGKLSMRGTLIPVRCQRLFDGGAFLSRSNNSRNSCGLQHISPAGRHFLYVTIF
jgi:hypothetical protein